MTKNDEPVAAPAPITATLSLDEPRPNARVYDECISVSGCLTTSGMPEVLRVFCDDLCVGATRVFTPRVSSAGPAYGFRLLARLASRGAAERQLSLRVTLNLVGSEQAADLGEVSLRVVPARLSERAYGDVVAPDRRQFLHRENIYGFGPPLEEPGAEILRLILEFLPASGSVLDLGCGAGAYGPPLRDAGHRWLGAELQPLCWSILERRGLPFQRLKEGERQLPFKDEEFDFAIAIEVLEHVAELDPLVAELSRVTRGRLLVSVPNLEVLPYYAPLGVVPWHLLESTHVNFFTRASLRAALEPHFRAVEVFSYAEPPVKTPDGIALHAHLFAIADK